VVSGWWHQKWEEADVGPKTVDWTSEFSWDGSADTNRSVQRAWRAAILSSENILGKGHAEPIEGVSHTVLRKGRGTEMRPAGSVRMR
jgi:hypothetical protein